jgi:hypothetical protein
MATQFDFASLGNMFGGMPGATPTGLDALLTEDQRKLLGRNAALSAAGALLQASGRSAVPISMGQALGGALQAGQQGYQQARAGSFQDLLLGGKLKEMQQEAARQTAFTNLFSGGTPGGLTPAQASLSSLSAPIETAGRVGPTPDRAALMTAAPAAPQGGPFPFLSQTQRALLSGMKPEQGFPELLKMSQAAEEYGPPTPVVMNGRTVMVQYNKQGQPRIAPGVMPYEAQSPDIRAVEYISGQPLAGTGTAGIGQVGEYRKQIAPTTKVDVKIPPGPSQFLAGAGTETIKVLGDLTAGARSANETLINVEKMLPALDKAILGPAADYRTAMLRIGQQLGVAGADANEQLANTRIVVQGLAQQELDAAAQMRGQGSLTEGERGILRRAAAGDQTLSAAEIRQALSTAQKTSRYRLAAQEDYLKRAMKIPGFEQFAPMYQVTPYGGGGGGNPLLNAIDQQLQLRSGGGPR